MEKELKALGYIKAMTSYGGDEYPKYMKYYTTENENAYVEWLKEQPKISGKILYRGYTFDEMYFSDGCYEVDSVINVDNLTQDTAPSFTTDFIRACLYINEYGEIALEDRVRVLFVIHTKGKYFVDISKYSAYPEEKEYKCCNDLKLRIKSIKRKGGYTEMCLIED